MRRILYTAGVVFGVGTLITFSLMWIVYAVAMLLMMFDLISQDTFPLIWKLGCMSPFLFGLIPFLLSHMCCDALSPHLSVAKRLKWIHALLFFLLVGTAFVTWLWRVN
jgi:hypothetical protein